MAGARETRKLVTVVFCDVTGSTTIGEQVDPEALRRLMERYYERMRGVVEQHGGAVEKMIGDAVMGVFGIPQLREDDALRAVRAADEMRSTLLELNRELEDRWGVQIQTRTGVNTGETLASNMNSFITGGVAGDAVNVAARLEQAAAPGEILVGEVTYGLVRDAVEVESVGALDLKGKAEGVQAFRLLSVAADRGSARRSEAPMVGRSEPLAALHTALDAAVAERHAEMVTVIGAAGVGKSRLIEEFTDAARERAGLLQGRCLSYGEGITFWPLGEMIRQAARLSEDDDSVGVVRKIRALVEGDSEAEVIADRIAALLGLGGTPGGLDESYWAVRRLFTTMARERPLILLFEDVYWAEPGLLDLIEHLARLTKEAPLLILCVARPVLLEKRPGWEQAVPGATMITLDPLDERQARELITALLGGTVSLADDVVARLASAAEGNPLFVEELVSMLIDRGVLRQDPVAGWVVDEGADPNAFAVPPTISAVLAARLEELGPDERTGAECASIGGRVFYGDATAWLMPGELRGGKLEVCGSGRGGELSRRWPSELAGRDAFAFRHVLIREVTYGSLPKGERAILHERLAEWIEAELGARAGEYDEIVGYHYEQAFGFHQELGPVSPEHRAIAVRGARKLGAAGRRALARLDAPAAANLLGRAADLFSPKEDAAERDALLPGLVRALTDLGEFDRAGATVGALESAPPADPVVRAAADLAALELGSLVAPEGWAERAERQARAAVEVFSGRGDERGLADAWGLLTDVALLRCRSADASAAALEAMEQARRVGDSSGHYFSSYSIALFFGPTPVVEAIERCQEVLDSWEVGRGPRAATLWSLAGLHAMAGDLSLARTLVEESAVIDEDLGREVVAAQGRAEMLGRVEMLAGNWTAAEEALGAGYLFLESLGERNYLSTLAAMRARVAWEQERLEDADRFATVSEETTAEDDVGSGILWRCARALVQARRGDQMEAVATARAAIDLAETTDYLDLQAGAWLDLALVQRDADDTVTAIASAATARERFEAKGNIVSAARAADVAATGER